jgi:hypothetical protein
MAILRSKAAAAGLADRLARPRQMVLHLRTRAVRVAGFEMAEQIRLCLPARWGGIRTLTALHIGLQLATSARFEPHGRNRGQAHFADVSPSLPPTSPRCTAAR